MRIVHVSGKRKKAISKAALRQGSGIVRVNGKLLDHYSSKLARMKISESLMLAQDYASKVDIDIKVEGGGVFSQADAARLSIARAIIEYSKDKKLEKEFLDYDRHLLIADVRQREDRKPNSGGKARSKVQKSYR